MITALYNSVLAQTSMMPTGVPSLDLLTQLVAALGPMGFVMWLVWRTTNHTIPRLAKSFEEGVDRQRLDFRQMMTEQRADFMRELALERELRERQMDRFASATEKLAKG